MRLFSKERISDEDSHVFREERAVPHHDGAKGMGIELDLEVFNLRVKGGGVLSVFMEPESKDI